jgi:hypothetical protein
MIYEKILYTYSLLSRTLEPYYIYSVARFQTVGITKISFSGNKN